MRYSHACANFAEIPAPRLTIAYVELKRFSWTVTLNLRYRPRTHSIDFISRIVNDCEQPLMKTILQQTTKEDAHATRPLNLRDHIFEARTDS